MSPRSSPGPVAVAAGLAFTLGTAGALAAVVARAAGRDPGAVVLGLSIVALLLAVLTAAGLAAHALLRRRWGWAAAIVVAWPLSVPPYVWTLRRERSAEAEV